MCVAALAYSAATVLVHRVLVQRMLFGVVDQRVAWVKRRQVSGSIDCSKMEHLVSTWCQPVGTNSAAPGIRQHGATVRLSWTSVAEDVGLVFRSEFPLDTQAFTFRRMIPVELAGK